MGHEPVGTSCAEAIDTQAGRRTAATDPALVADPVAPCRFGHSASAWASLSLGRFFLPPPRTSTDRNIAGSMWQGRRWPRRRPPSPPFSVRTHHGSAAPAMNRRLRRFLVGGGWERVGRRQRRLQASASFFSRPSWARAVVVGSRWPAYIHAPSNPRFSLGPCFLFIRAHIPVFLAFKMSSQSRFAISASRATAVTPAGHFGSYTVTSPAGRARFLTADATASVAVMSQDHVFNRPLCYFTLSESLSILGKHMQRPCLFYVCRTSIRRLITFYIHYRYGLHVPSDLLPEFVLLLSSFSPFALPTSSSRSSSSSHSRSSPTLVFFSLWAE